MSTINVDYENLGEAIGDLEKRIVSAIHKALETVAHEDAVAIIGEHVPVAFGELKRSIEGEGAGSEVSTVVDAPHAAAVEVGSRPHTPDIESLTEWVRLRIGQGVTPQGTVREKYPRSWGPTTPRQATAAANEALRLSKQNGGKPHDQAEEIARRIAKHIMVAGTEPHWYVRNSMEEIGKAIGNNLRKYLSEV